MASLKIIFVAFLLIGCSRNGIRQQLYVVDSLLQQDSDSVAKKKFDAINKEILEDGAEKAHYSLLKIQLLSRSYQVVPDRLINDCIDYYSKTGNSQKLAECYYYKGGKSYDSGNISYGILLFKRAEELADTTDIQLSYKICESLAFGNFSDENYSLALNYAKLGAAYAVKMHNCSRYVFSKYYESISYSKLGYADSSNVAALEYIRCIDSLNIGEQKFYLAEASKFYTQINKIDSALFYLTRAKSLGTDAVVWDAEGVYFMRKKNYVAAERAYLKCLAVSPNLVYRIDSYKQLGNIMMACNKMDSASFYFKKESEATDSLIHKRQISRTADVQYGYDADLLKAKGQKKYQSSLFIFWGILFLLTAIMLFALKMNKKIMVRVMAEKDSLLKQLTEELEVLKGKCSNRQREVSKLKRQVEETFANCIDDVCQGKDMYDKFINGGIKSKPNQKVMKQILAYYRTIAPDFFVDLESRYNTLTPQNQFILMLRDMGKSDKEICLLLGISAVSLRSYVTRIKKCVKDGMAMVLLFLLAACASTTRM